MDENDREKYIKYFGAENRMLVGTNEPKMTWVDILRRDLKTRGFNKEIAHNHAA